MDSDFSFLVTMATLPKAEALIAKLKPAMPLPKIKKSVLNSIDDFPLNNGCQKFVYKTSRLLYKDFIFLAKKIIGKEQNLIVLGIESSCDETAAAVVVNGKILSNVIASQIKDHSKYGGVVPEIASRKHIEAINPVLQQAMADAHVTFRK